MNDRITTVLTGCAAPVIVLVLIGAVTFFISLGLPVPGWEPWAEYQSMIFFLAGIFALMGIMDYRKRCLTFRELINFLGSFLFTATVISAVFRYPPYVAHGNAVFLCFVITTVCMGFGLLMGVLLAWKLRAPRTDTAP